jgi:Putative Ig domain
MESGIMPLSYNSIISGSSGADFTINIGTSGYTKVDLGKDFGSGNYICTSSLSDSTLDIYFLNSSDNSVAGYVNAAAATATISATKTFRYVVIYGATNNDTLTFQYKTVASPTLNSTTDLVIGPRITNVATVNLPNLNDTTVVTGQNFGTNITATFTGTDSIDRNAKSIVRSSSTSLIITRPDTMPPSANPYTLTLLNPGTQAPTSSNSHKSINTISAGASPVWVTGSTLHYDLNVAWNGGNLSATDSDGGSSVTYSIVSGTLPTGLSLSSNGTISGTPTTSQQSVTFRATDSGSNYVDKTILFNQKPVWTTTSLPNAQTGSAYSQTLATTDDTGVARTYSLVSGTLPAGLSLASNGVISGTPSAGNGGSNLVFRATDGNGGTQDKTLTIATTVIVTFTSSGSWTVPSGVSAIDALVVAGGAAGATNGSGNPGRNAGGGGAGGFRNLTNVSVGSAGTVYAVTVGAGGAGSSDVFNGNDGNNSSIGSLIIASKGGSGGANSTAGRSGGSGGGAGDHTGTLKSGGSGNLGSYSPVEGYAGGNATGSGAGGGGAGGAASSASSGNATAGGPGAYSSITGSSVQYAGGGGGAASNGGASGGGGGGGNGAMNANGGNGTANTGGGGGASAVVTSGGGTSGSGGSGIVIIKYIG